MQEIAINEKDVTQAILSLKNSVSRTPDSIPAFYLRKTHKNLVKPLKRLLIYSLRTGKLPRTWKSAVVIPLFKKGQKNTPTNYRPISLTSVICRILEYIIHSMMVEMDLYYNTNCQISITT